MFASCVSVSRNVHTVRTEIWVNVSFFVFVFAAPLYLFRRLGGRILHLLLTRTNLVPTV